MNVTVLDIKQRSREWYAARAGRLTGSNAADMLAMRKDKSESADRRHLRMRLVCERLTGRAEDEDTFITAEIRRGILLEPDAAAAYEARPDSPIVQWSGFLSHNELMVGCSLDGHVGELGGIIEIKCPKSATHLGYLQGDCVPVEYLPQATHNLWVSGAEWCDFVSYDDRFTDPALHLFVKRIARADVNIEAYAEKVTAFLAEVDRDVAALSMPPISMSFHEQLVASLALASEAVR